MRWFVAGTSAGQDRDLAFVFQLRYIISDYNSMLLDRNHVGMIETQESLGRFVDAICDVVDQFLTAHAGLRNSADVIP